jgi:hypothetical protein
VTQAWAYGDAKGAAGGMAKTSRGLSVRRLVFERCGAPVAVCQVLDKVVAGVCLASRVNRGPLLLGESRGDAECVYRALRRRWRHLRHGVLLLAPALEASDDNGRLLREAGFRPRRVKGWCSTVLDLRRDESELRANLAPTWRNRLRSAERSGLAFSASETEHSLSWILACHVENMKAKDFLGPSAAFVDSLCRASPGDWFVCQGHLPGEPEPVAGMLVCRFANTAEYFVGWFGPAGRRVAASNFLYWNAVLEAQRRGCLRFDLGGYSPTEKFGLRHFKQGMRGSDYQLAHEWIAL